MRYTQKINIRQGCISGSLSRLKGAVISAVGVTVLDGNDNYVSWDRESAVTRNVYCKSIDAMEVFCIATVERLIEYLDAAVKLNAPSGSAYIHYSEWREPKGFEFCSEKFNPHRVEEITWSGGRRVSRPVLPRRWVKLPGTVWGRWEKMEPFEFARQQNVRRGLWSDED